MSSDFPMYALSEEHQAIREAVRVLVEHEPGVVCPVVSTSGEREQMNLHERAVAGSRQVVAGEGQHARVVPVRRVGPVEAV